MNTRDYQKLFTIDPDLARHAQAQDTNSLLKEVISKLGDNKEVKISGVAHLKGDSGYTPVKGVDYFTEEEVNQFIDDVTPVKGVHYFDGVDGKDGVDGESIEGPRGLRGPKGADGATPEIDYDYVLQMINDSIKEGTLDKENLVVTIIDKIKKEKLLHIQDLGGYESFVYNGKRYKFSELMHGGGSSTGGGFTELTATGSVNGVNADFTFTSEPTYIVSDGVFYKPVGKNLTINWTWNAGTLTATMSIPPIEDIYGIK